MHLQSQVRPLRELPENHRIQHRVREPVLDILKRPALLLANLRQRRRKLRDLILIRDGLQVSRHVDSLDLVVLPAYTPMISELAITKHRNMPHTTS